MSRLPAAAHGRPRRCLLRRCAAALLGILLGAAVPARAVTTRYVDALAGNDALDGLAATVGDGHGPKATIQAAIAAAAPGDTIVVYPGAYPETVRFTTADLTLTSLDPAAPATVAATLISGDPAAPTGCTGVVFDSAAGPDAVLAGFTVSTGWGRGIECSAGATPTITHCVLRGNQGSTETAGGAILCRDSAPLIRNTVIYGNASLSGPGGVELLRSSPQFVNCTLADNTGAGDTQAAGGGLLCRDSSPLLRNCILWGNTDAAWPDCPQIVCRDSSAPSVSYCCVQGGLAVGAPGASWGAGNLAADPRFANPAAGDYRLRSTSGRWEGTQWLLDDVNSPGIDAGDPTDDWTAESAPNGERINLGFDGNTALASRSPAAMPEFVLDPPALTLAEGATAVVTISLSRVPAVPLSVGVRLDPPEAGVTLVSGQPFTLDAANWVTGLPLGLSATEDDADSVDAVVTLWVEAAGLTPASLRIAIADNDVTLSVNGGTPAGTTFHTRGAEVPISAEPPEHWHFVRWQGDTATLADPLAATTFIRLEAPAVVSAQFAIDRHALVINSDFGAPQGAGEYDHGATAVWSVSSPVAVAAGERRVADSAGAAVVMDADRTITVRWRTEVLLTPSADGPGGVEPAACWCVADTVARLTAVPERGCHFRGWDGDVPPEQNFDNPLSLVMDRPRTVRAVFARNPVSTWATVTVNQPLRPGADCGWIEAFPDPSGGWQSDVSIAVPPEAPAMPLAYCRAWPFNTPQDVVGGDFEHDSPGCLPQDWRRCPQWSTERCLVTSAAPLYPGYTRALLLQGSGAGPQGLTVPCSALFADAVVQFAVFLPEILPTETVLAEFWHNRIGVVLHTDASAEPLITLDSAGARHPVAANHPLVAAAWNTVTLFLWSRSDADGDGLDDGWEKLTFRSLAHSGAEDADGDGLNNLAEYRYGTAATDPDTDHDGMPDGWEVAARLDPCTHDASADPDGDGCPNALEARLGSDPHLADAPRALFASLSSLASFWPLALSFDNSLAPAPDLTPDGEAGFANEALLLEGAGSARLNGLPACQAAAPARALALWFRSTGGGTLLHTTAAANGLSAATLCVDALGRLSATIAGTGVDSVDALWTLDVDTDPNAWHHIVLTCSDFGNPVLFLDGNQARTDRLSTPTVHLQPARWDDICIGAGSAAADNLLTPFRGQICGLAWFSAELPAAAVMQLHRAGRALTLDTLLPLDLDTDGLPDCWEYACFASLDMQAQDDPDDDGLTNADERRLGCNPGVPDSDGDGLGDGAEVHTDGTDPRCRDSDGDGLDDGREVSQVGSDPSRTDTDDDGLPDGWEVAHGFSPVRADSDDDGVPDAVTDRDGDGFTNAAELARGTDPDAPDVGASVVSFVAQSTAVREAGAALQIAVTLSELPPGRDTVTLVVARTDGTASPGTDFEFADTPVTFSAGHLSALVEVTVLADVTPEPDETIILAIQAVRGARIGLYGIHAIVITDALSAADDTDTDGLPDAWEVRWFGDLEQGAEGDFDRDGLTNLEEYRCGARPDRPYRNASAAELGLRVTELGR